MERIPIWQFSSCETHQETTNLVHPAARRLFGRRTKTLLPVSDQLLQPKVVENVAANLKNERDRQKRYYDQHTASLPKLEKRRPRNGTERPEGKLATGDS